MTVDTRLAMGDPATELIKVVRGARRRSDCDVDARPPLRQGRPARRHRRQASATWSRCRSCCSARSQLVVSSQLASKPRSPLTLPLCYKALDGRARADPRACDRQHPLHPRRDVAGDASSPRSPAGAAWRWASPRSPPRRWPGRRTVRALGGRSGSPRRASPPRSRWSTMTIKARRTGAPLSSAAPAYRFALAYVPPLVAGMVLTPVFATLGLVARAAGLLAAALRHRRHDRRRVLGPRRAADGRLLHGARRGRVRRACRVG